MIRLKHSLGLISALLLTAACSGGGDASRPTNTGGSNNPAAGNGSGAGLGNNGGNVGVGGNGTTPNGGNGSSNGGAASLGGAQSVGSSLDCAAPNKGRPALRLLTRSELENTLNDIFPTLKGQWSDSLPANVVSDSGFDNDGATTPGQQYVAALNEVATDVATQVSGSALANILPCSASAADRSCAQTYLDQYGKRLYRRPLSDTEKNRYLTFFDSTKASSDFKTAIKWITVGLIQSPNSVFKSELGTNSGGGRKLTNYEIATELAYTYSGSTPSADLLSKADQGNLGDLVAAAKAMLQTDAGKQQIQRFFEGYLDYTRVASASKPNITQPVAFPTLALDMLKETRAFIDDVVIQKGGGLKELLTATTTNPSKQLATFYASKGTAFPTPSADYASVQRPAEYGVGMLAQASFLASHANSDASSPTQRGLFAFYRLLCNGKLTPPPNVPSITAAQQTQTTRQRYEQAHISASGACPTCHKHFDPIGFGLEHFDEGGLYRSQQNGVNIDSAAAVPAADLSPLFSFTGENDLASGFANLPEAYQCFAAYLATYAYGTSDSCLGPSQVPALQAGTMGVVDAFAALAAEAHFTQRNAP